jgi:hypothetical protein
LIGEEIQWPYRRGDGKDYIKGVRLPTKTNMMY